MASRHTPWVAGLILLSISGCMASNRGTNPSPEAQSNQQIRALERRLDQLEQQLRVVEGGPASDSKTPAGPLRSLTLRIGTTDDRLRMYWADGQTSDLLCNQEGQSTWACG